MNRCYQSISWETGVNFALTGLSLGFDRHVEHVEGLSQLMAKLGALVAPRAELSDQTIPIRPSVLRFDLYELEPADKRRRSYPAALLCLVHSEGDVRDVEGPPSCAELVHRYDLGFVSEPIQKNHDLSHDLVTAWGAEGFAVHVRGARNISLLRQLHRALLDGEVAVWASATSDSTVGPLRLVLVGKTDIIEKQTNLLLVRLSQHDSMSPSTM